MITTLIELSQDYTFQTIALGTLLLGIISGVIGSFTVLRKQGLLGDGISHSTLPGITLAFIFMQTKDSSVLLLGAGIAGLIAMMAILNIIKYTRVKFDAALALIFSVFFGLGMVGLSYIQKSPNSSQAGLDSFIFGQAAAMIQSDLSFMLVCGLIILGITALYWKEFQLFIFDADYAHSLGYSSRFLNIMLSIMVVLGIIVGLKTVGAILMCAMLICPAVAARQWTDKFPKMVLLAAIFASLAGLVGTGISSLISRMPTGPIIVVCINIITLLSILLAPGRGLIARIYQRRQNKIKMSKKGVAYVIGD